MGPGSFRLQTRSVAEDGDPRGPSGSPQPSRAPHSTAVWELPEEESPQPPSPRRAVRRQLLGCSSCRPGSAEHSAAPCPATPAGLRSPLRPPGAAAPPPGAGRRQRALRGRPGLRAAVRAAMAGPLLGRAVSARLLRLEGRLARAERRLRLALALRGRVRALERRLEPPRGAPRRGDGAEGARRRRGCGRKDGEGSGAAAESGRRSRLRAAGAEGGGEAALRRGTRNRCASDQSFGRCGRGMRAGLAQEGAQPEVLLGLELVSDTGADVA